MIEIPAILFWGLAEVAGGLLLVLVVMIVVAMRRRTQRLAAVRALASAVQAELGSRAERMSNILVNRYAYQDEKLKKTVKTIKRREAGFYQTLIALIKENDMSRLGDIRMQFDSAVDPYRSLDVPEVAVSAEIKPDHHHPELEDLRNKNRELTEELGITMETLGRMLKEYSTMFDPEKRAEVEALVAEKSEPEPDQDALVEEDEAKALIKEAVGDGGDILEEEAEISPETDEVSDDDLVNDLMGSDDAPLKEPEPKEQLSDDDLLNQLMGSDEIPPEEPREEHIAKKNQTIDPDELLDEIAADMKGTGLVPDVKLKK